MRCGGILFAQKDEAECREGVERNPKAGNQLLLDWQRRRLNDGLLNVWQLLELMRLAGIDVVDEAIGGGAFLDCRHCQPASGGRSTRPRGVLPIDAVGVGSERLLAERSRLCDHARRKGAAGKGAGGAEARRGERRDARGADAASWLTKDAHQKNEPETTLRRLSQETRRQEVARLASSAKEVEGASASPLPDWKEQRPRVQ
jgi:hypothetical protein